MKKNFFTVPENLSKRLQSQDISLTNQFLYVNIQQQTLTHIQQEKIMRTFTISTSRYGIGNNEGSNMTPLGIHRITNKIGTDAPIGSIFKDRKNTGIIWQPSMNSENQILTRIMRLEGLEPTINKGHGIDSYERYIYIHGTNKEELIGTPLSHGCICMKNQEIIELYNLIPEGTIVIIN